ncbi:MAG: Vacuolar protein 8 [Trizodia sp. TS-e1964]|nr:MAG: Vacuolar protein 8 [Trizodia sp. TS-e1964]
MGNVWSACCRARSGEDLYEPVLADREREAVADLLQYLADRAETDFFTGKPLEALSILVYSDNVELQRSASLTFAEITERDVREVDRDTLDPILSLLQSTDIEVQRAASAALGNLAVNADNKVLIVSLGGLAPLIRQMMSPNVEVQCNAVGCITNLATHEENKAKIARSGALGPLTRLAKSKDMRVQRNATGALLNMTHSDENRQQLVNAGAIPVLVQLLSSQDVDVQYYCTTALSNIAVDANNRKKLAQTENRLVQSLVHLMDSSSPKVQCQAALALRNLASDEKYQLEIVRHRGLTALLRLLKSSYLPLILSAVACIRNISIHPMNESPIIDAGFLKPLVELLGSRENEEIQCHAISTLRNLAASSDRNKRLVLEAGAVQKCKDLVLDAPLSVQSEMTAAIAVLALSDDLKSHLLALGVFDVLIPLTDSDSVEVQGNSAAALGNLSSKVGDYSIFIQGWTKPDGGIHGYLNRFLSSGDPTFQHIAIWTLLQLLDCDDKRLLGLILEATDVIYMIKEIADKASTAGSEDGVDDNGEEEVVALAQRSMEMMDKIRRDLEDNTTYGGDEAIELSQKSMDKFRSGLDKKITNGENSAINGDGKEKGASEVASSKTTFVE